MTGYWVQLEDETGRVIYRRDHPSLIRPIVQDAEPGEMEIVSVLVPFMKAARTLAIFAPPRGPEGQRPHLGLPSELVGRFDITEFEIPDAQLEGMPLPADICGNGRGRVMSHKSVIYHGRTDNIYNLVVLGDGFTDSQQQSFNNAASNCVNWLLSYPPFTSVLGAGALNVFFVNVASNEGERYFNSVISPDSTGISWDSGCVTTVCDDIFIQGGQTYWNWAALIVNYSTKRIGTSGGSQFAVGTWGGYWYETAKDDYMRTFQHEFGHSGFGLSDEYSKKNKGSYPYSEPSTANVTTKTTLADLKWEPLVTPGIDIPTLGNPSDCSKPDTRGNPASDADVGLYSGGATYVCDIYRGQYKCVMKQQSDVHGAFCKICQQEATKIVARAAPLLVPAPGSVFYSPISRTWSHARVAANVVDKYETLKNYSQYRDVIDELLDPGSYPALTAVRAAFTKVGRPLGADIEVHRSYWNEGVSDGVWYLIDHATLKTNYVHAFELEMYNELALGEILLPDFPSLTNFDGAVVGTEIDLFSTDGNQLAFGRLDSAGQVEGGGFTPQSVTGLEDDVDDVSTAFVTSQIWVAVIDRLTVKIAAYQLLRANWWEPGFISLPVETPTDFRRVRVTQQGNLVHALATSDTGVYYAEFDTISRVWKAEPAITPFTGAIEPYDIASDENNVYAIVKTPVTVLMNACNLDGGGWGDNVDITSALGLETTDIVTSLGCAVLERTLHIVALIGQVARHAIYDLAKGEWIQPLTDIAPLESLTADIGAMMAHADGSQLYVGLSKV